MPWTIYNSQIIFLINRITSIIHLFKTSHLNGRKSSNEMTGKIMLIGIKGIFRFPKFLTDYLERKLKSKIQLFKNKNKHKKKYEVVFGR